MNKLNISRKASGVLDSFPKSNSLINKIMDFLNNDPKAQSFMKDLKALADQKGWSQEQFDKAKQDFLFDLFVTMVKEHPDILSDVADDVKNYFEQVSKESSLKDSMIDVNNCDPIRRKYVVVRDCGSSGYWFYGQWDDLAKASQALKDINNGIIVEAKDINPI